MLVRRAGRDDLLGIARVAEAGHWESYPGLLKPDTIARLLDRDYAPSALRRRLIGGGIVVAESGEALVGFADSVVEGGRIRLKVITTEPAHRRRGVARLLLEAIRELDESLPVCSDVLLGNLEGERFYEAHGFAPGEVIEGRLFDEDVIERRWWLAPQGA